MEWEVSGEARLCSLHCNESSVARNTFSVGLFFSSLEILAPYFNSFKKGNLFLDRPVDVALASTAKLISILATNPLYLLKTRAETGSISKQQNTMYHVKEIYRTGGLKGFYSGFMATFIRDVPYQGIQYGIYKFLGGIVGAEGRQQRTRNCREVRE